MYQNNKSKSLNSTGELIRKLRVDCKLPLRKVASKLDIDTSLLSKIERNEKRASRNQILKLEVIFGVEKNYLLVPYLSEKVFYEISEDDCASEVLKVAEKLVKYNKKS